MISCEGRDFVLKARKFNESLEDDIVHWMINKINANNVSRIGITGLAFKGKPDTSDLRGSSSVNIIKKLKKKIKR